jgi:hypothetical protein
MTNILTDAEAAEYIRTDAEDPAMLQLLPQVDAYLKAATGRDWAADATKHPLAKTAAGIILASWYDDPGQIGTSPSRAYSALLQLEVEGLKYRKYTFFGSNGAGGISVPGALVGDAVQKLVGVYGSSGDQSSKFESVVTETGALQQTNGADLSENIYVVVLKSPAEDVTA